MLKAGYMEDWRYQATYSGTPQGGIVSPILANIVLNELDNFVQTELFAAYNKGERRRPNPDYQRIQKRIQYARRKGRWEIVKELEQQRRQIPSGIPDDPDYRRIRYCRYADDFLIGYIGPRKEAEEIKEKIKAFLKTIKLDLSEEKTLISHATTGKARFLGYDIHIAIDNHQMTVQDREKTTYHRRALNMTPILTVPQDVARYWRMKYTKQGKPTNRPELLQSSDMEIVTTYGQEFQGVVNYYSLAHNVSWSFYPVKHIFMESAVRTLANKHKTSRGKIYAKYKRRSEHGVKALIVEKPNPNNPDKPYRAKFGDKPIRVTFDTIIKDNKEGFYVGHNELVKRLLAGSCELCGSTDRIQVHHIRKLADVRKQYRNNPSAPAWTKLMMARHRKTVVVCHQCHRHIHNGTYDGEKVN